MYKINGTDLFSSCGFLANRSRESVNSFERPRNAAEVFSHKWDNGVVEYDLATLPAQEPRVFRIAGFLFATSEADYNLKKANLDALVRVQKQTIYVQQIDTTVSAKFKAYTQWERVTKIKGSSQIVIKVAMEFDELLGIAIGSYNVFYGAASAVPLTAAALTPFSQGVVGTEITIPTGITGRVIFLALQSDKSIATALDLDNPIFPVIAMPLQGTVTVSGINYRVFALELGAPYSTNHRFKITLS